MEVIEIPISDVKIGTRRALNQERVTGLAESISAIGLQTPISVRPSMTLIAGGHRLEAFKVLNKMTIPAVIKDCDDTEAEMIEISENLHRSELTQLERSEYIVKWIGLAKALKTQHNTSDQVEHSHPDDVGHSETARRLGISRSSVVRASQAASLTDDAKQAARATGMDDNLQALTEISHEPAEQQARSVRKRAKKRRPKPDMQKYDGPTGTSVKWRRAFANAWSKADTDDREWALGWLKLQGH